MLDYPFLRPEFLDALVSSESVGGDTGWTPLPVDIDSTAFMPLYLKTHSWGEYVFDWAWADAYRRHGLDYYPKLVSAIPYTPVTGPRIRFAPGADRASLGRELVDRAIALARDCNASGWHVLFPDDSHLALLDDERLLRRTGVQYHWFNRGYGCFDDFLQTLASRKRKMIRRERRQVAEQGLDIQVYEGADITPDLWEFFYRVYHRTYLKRSGGTGYLTRSFFRDIGRALPKQIALAVAREKHGPVAAALYLYDDHQLYGRYWGCLREFDCLHFELCYYQGIEIAIRKGLQKFDAGAQGEHKILRGFQPVFTHSLHWIADPRFAEAIGAFLRDERRHLEQYRAEAESLLPYRKAAE